MPVDALRHVGRGEEVIFYSFFISELVGGKSHGAASPPEKLPRLREPHCWSGAVFFFYLTEKCVTSFTVSENVLNGLSAVIKKVPTG